MIIHISTCYLHATDCYSASACWADQGEDARNAEAKIMGSRITEGGDFKSRHMASKNSTQFGNQFGATQVLDISRQTLINFYQFLLLDIT